MKAPTHDIVLHFIGIFAPLILWCQTPEQELVAFRTAYPKESAVITDIWRQVNVERIGDSLQVIVEQYQETLVLANPHRYSKDRVFSSSFRALESIEAYTLTPGTKKYKKLPVSDYVRSFDKDSYVFFDDSEVISYNYPQVEIGCKVVTKHRWRVTDPRLLGQFFFQKYHPVAKARLTVEFSNDVDMKISTTEGRGNQPYESQEHAMEGGTRYTFTAENLPAIKYESDNPAFAWLSPSVYARVAGYRTSDGAEVKVLDSLDDLYGWYQGFLEQVDFEASLKEVTAEIVDPDDSDEEKVKKIFYWVQRNVRYIAFEQGMRGFVPHSPDYVLEKRYGDCKDMSSLLVGLLRAEDIPAQFTWVGTRDLPYRYSEIPSPLVDNHMIASVRLADRTLFLDATGSHVPFGFPTSMIQGKEALIGEGSTYRLADVPVVAKEDNAIIDTVLVRMQDGDLIGSGQLTLSGLARVEQAESLVRRTEQEVEERLKTLLNKGNSKFFLEHHRISPIEDLDQPIKINYDFRIEDYYQSVGDEMYVNLCLDKRMAEGIIKERSTPMANDFKFIHRTVIIFDLPSDLALSYLPSDQSWRGKDFGFDVTYTEQGATLCVTNEYFVDFLMLSKDRFEDWNNGLRAYTKAIRNSVVLKSMVE